VKLRVLHTPQIVGGHAGLLASAEREIGMQSTCVTFSRHPFDYRHDEVLWDQSHTVVVNEIKRLKLLWRAMREFDVIHFNFGMSILPRRFDDAIPSGRSARKVAYDAYVSLVEYLDLPLLKKAGKRIFVTYQGDDARQGSYCRAHFPISPIGEVSADYYTPRGDLRKQREIGIFDRHADGIYALNPDLLHVLPPRARFLPYASVDLRKWSLCPPRDTSKPLVVHAPSHRGVKGTRFVLDAVSRLKADGLAFDFVLIEGMKNEEARRIYEKADVLIDQLLLGWYGGIAVEFMALGKPVICYIREDDLRFIDSDMRQQLPIIRAEPGTIYQVLRESLTGKRSDLAEVGARGRAFVERWHDPIKTARILQQDYLSALSPS
jgi:glycosyltransferase involved in cell wall biosynthesis